MRCIGWGTQLVVDDSDDETGFREPQYSLDKIGTPRAMKPRCAHDHVARAGHRYQLLAFKLGAPVDTHWPDRIVLAIGPIGSAVEDVVSREVNKRNTEVIADVRQMTSAPGIDRMGQIWLALGLINRCVGCCI